MHPGVDSSYRTMQVVPDCEAPTTAHCGCVCSHANPKIGYESTSKTCVNVSALWSKTAITPSFRPANNVPGRVGWNSNCRTPLLESNKRRACGTTSSSATSGAVIADLLIGLRSHSPLCSATASPEGNAASSKGAPRRKRESSIMASEEWSTNAKRLFEATAAASCASAKPAALQLTAALRHWFLGLLTASRRKSTTVRRPTAEPPSPVAATAEAPEGASGPSAQASASGRPGSVAAGRVASDKYSRSPCVHRRSACNNHPGRRGSAGRPG
mmetsp:Transcript_93319/g.260935  ORF Transcript_93319/g.260935 Transcript_93319/m.260935 type:complete len:271 (-) Transcript_93319:1434-2246(-)